MNSIQVRIIYSVAFSVLLLLASQYCVLAATALEISADTVSYQHPTGVALFQGHVHYQQGNAQLTADTLTVYRNTDNTLNRLRATGNPVHYWTTLPSQKTLNIRAKTLQYYAKTGIIELIGKGEVTQGKNQFTGSHILYDIGKRTIKATPIQRKPNT